jgi:hydrogenase nickel incorporation protein HypA/HybF
MHESSLGKQLVRVALESAGDAARVRTVRGWVAETEHLDAEAIAFHFAAHARGTRADGAELLLTTRHVEAACRGCGARYLPDHHLLLCPSCGSTEGDLLGPTGVGIDTIDVEHD